MINLDAQRSMLENMGFDPKERQKPEDASYSPIIVESMPGDNGYQVRFDASSPPFKSTEFSRFLRGYDLMNCWRFTSKNGKDETFRTTLGREPTEIQARIMAAREIRKTALALAKATGRFIRDDIDEEIFSARRVAFYVVF